MQKGKHSHLHKIKFANLLEYFLECDPTEIRVIENEFGRRGTPRYKLFHHVDKRLQPGQRDMLAITFSTLYMCQKIKCCFKW